MVPFRQFDRVFAVRKGTSVRLWPDSDDLRGEASRQLSGVHRP